MRIKLGICVAFFYRKEYLNTLKLTLNTLAKLKDETSINLITNTNIRSEIKSLNDILLTSKLKKFKIYTPYLLGHPLLLPYSNLPVMKKLFHNKTFTHFLFIEDDILFTQKNLNYWLKHNKILKETTHYPSFIRIEKNAENKFVYPDVNRRIKKNKQPSLILANQTYINIPYPYQGMYLYDRDQMYELFTSPCTSPNFTKDEIIEMANLGLTYHKVPKNFYSRNLLALKDNNIDEGAFIIHTRSNSRKRKLIKKSFFSRRWKLLDVNGFTTSLGTIEKDDLFI